MEGVVLTAPLDVDAWLTVAPAAPIAAPRPVTPSESPDDAKLAAAKGLLAPLWPKVDRHRAQLALIGGLMRAGWDDARILSFVDESFDSSTPGYAHRAQTVATTRTKYEASGKITGFGSDGLQVHIPKKVVDAVRSLLGFDEDFSDFSAFLKAQAAPPAQVVDGVEVDALLRPPSGKKRKLGFDEVCFILSNAPQWAGVFRYNVLSRRHVAVKPPERLRMEHGNFSRGDVNKIRGWFANASPVDPTDDEASGYSVGEDMIKGAVARICETTGRAYNPFAEYLDALPPASGNLAQVHATILGCPGNPMASVFFTKALVAAVRRARAMPGVGESPRPVDHQWILVLVGAQDAGKGRLLKILAGREFYHTMTGDLEDKDTVIKAQGSVIVELEELTTAKSADRDKLKAFLSRDDDYERAAYAEGAEHVQRSYVIFGTGNDPELYDPTGLRRFVVVEVGGIDHAAAERLRDALWSEANALAATSYDHHLTAEEKSVAAHMTARHTRVEGDAEAIEEACHGRDFVTLREVYDEMTRGTKRDDPMPRAMQKTVCDALRGLGCRPGERQHRRGWHIPEEVKARSVSNAARAHRSAVAAAELSDVPRFN